MLAQFLPAKPLLLVSLHPEQLFLIVPFVKRARLVEPFVTLQPNKLSAQNFGENFRNLSLPRARWTLDQQRLFKRQRKKNRRLNALISNVLSTPQPVGNLFMRKLHRAAILAQIVRS